jgi:sulfate permease, SulP family
VFLRKKVDGSGEHVPSISAFAVSIATMLGVVALDILNGILMALLIAILLLLMRVSRPADAVLGRVSGLKGFHNVLPAPQ